MSKIKRKFDYYTARLQAQERLVTQVVDEIWDELSKSNNPPIAMGLVLKATHLCKVMRGTKSRGEMITSCLKGKFKEDCSMRNEFLQLAK